MNKDRIRRTVRESFERKRGLTRAFISISGSESLESLREDARRRGRRNNAVAQSIGDLIRIRDRVEGDYVTLSQASRSLDEFAEVGFNAARRAQSMGMSEIAEELQDMAEWAGNEAVLMEA